MLRRALLLMVLPLTGVLAQAKPIRIVVTAANNRAFTVTSSSLFPDKPEFVRRGRWELAVDSATVGMAMIVASADTLKMIRVEALESGRVVAAADGVFVIVQRDNGSVSIEARSRVPPPRTVRDMPWSNAHTKS